MYSSGSQPAVRSGQFFPPRCRRTYPPVPVLGACYSSPTAINAVSDKDASAMASPGVLRPRRTSHAPPPAQSASTEDQGAEQKLAVPGAVSVDSISLSQAQATLPNAATLKELLASPYFSKPVKGEPGKFRYYLPLDLSTKVLQLQDGQAISYTVVREDEPDAVMPVAKTTVRVNGITGQRHVRAVAGTPNHITAGKWVVAGLRLSRVLWCSQHQHYVFVYSAAKEHLTSQTISYQQASTQLEQVYALPEPLMVPSADSSGVNTIYKFVLPKALFCDKLGLKRHDPITWTAVRQDQPDVQHQLMQARASGTGNTHYLTSARSKHVGMVGHWVHEEGLRLKQVRWSRQSGSMVAVFVYA